MVICKPSRVPHFLGARRDHSAHARQEIEDGRGLLPGGLEPAAEDDVPELAFPRTSTPRSSQRSDGSSAPVT